MGVFDWRDIEWTLRTQEVDNQSYGSYMIDNDDHLLSLGLCLWKFLLKPDLNLGKDRLKRV